MAPLTVYVADWTRLDERLAPQPKRTRRMEIWHFVTYQKARSTIAELFKHGQHKEPHGGITAWPAVIGTSVTSCMITWPTEMDATGRRHNLPAKRQAAQWPNG